VKTKLPVKAARAVLTETQVMEIRARYRREVFGSVRMGREYGVNHATIEHIVRGRTWKRLLPKNKNLDSVHETV